MGNNTAGVERLQRFGETIFATMTRAAQEAGAINLGQGFPDTDGPQSVLATAQAEIANGNNQYAPPAGFPVLREAIARRFERSYGIPVDPNNEVLVTVGATEGLAASVLGLVEPDDEVIVFEPYFDSYAAIIAMAGAKQVTLSLKATEDSWDLDIAALTGAITPRTRMILINSPHNPTGAVFTTETLEQLAQVAHEHDLYILADEVYEYQVFDGQPHRPLASFSGLSERTITVSSAAKTFQVTGWKTGWVIARAELIQAITRAKQFVTFVGFSAAQPAVAQGLNHEMEWVYANRAELERKRDFLAQALTDAGFKVAHTSGSFYIVADIRGITEKTGAEYCFELIKQVGVAAIPVEVFCDHPEKWQRYIRFAFCKQWDVLEEAARRLQSLQPENGA
ncbi:MAG: pyridoxal phosphate-dependent aminotransferase [Corynebacterium sp.]|nr:pyridoxal phosphate-dependent aminotransferase [Corynebacterium sp.]